MRLSVSLLCTLAALPAFAQDPDRVTMTLEEFLQLYESSRNRPEDPPPPPWTEAVSSARFVGEVQLEDDEPVSALFRATFRVQAFGQDPLVLVPILPSNVGIRSATIAGRPATLDVEGGWYTLLTERKDAFDLEVEFAVSVHSGSGQSGLSFELPTVGATTVELAVPAREDLTFEVANARYVTDRVDGARRIVSATVPSVGSVSITWQRAVSEAAQAPDEPRVYAEVYTLVGIGDGLLSAESTIQHTVLFAGVDQLKARIPEGATLIDVEGAGVRDWSVTGGLLTVDLNYEAEGSYPLTLRLERVIGEGDATADAPIPIPVGVERSKGWVGVESRGNLEIVAGSVSNASPVDVRALPAAILGVTDQPVLLGYKYLGENARIPLVVTQHDDVDMLVTLLDQARAATMWTPDGRMLTSMTYQVRNNRRQYLRLDLPDGAELWSASVGGRAVTPARAGDGKVLVPLVRSQAQGGALAAFEVAVVYVQDGAPADGKTAHFEASLPQADVPATYVAWSVYVPEEAKVPEASVSGSLRHVEALSNPISSSDVYRIETMSQPMNNVAQGQVANGGLGDGAAPVPVSLPLRGRPVQFEKLLVLDEALTVAFDLKKLPE
jgi:hypothetical protein